MNLLNAEQLHELLLEDLENCESYSFAVAWVTLTDYYELLRKHEKKVSQGIIGLNLYNTTPAILKEFRDKDAFFFRLDDVSVFHPKVHLFKFTNYAHIYIGSSNSTRGGLGKNTELNIMLEVDLDSDIYNQLVQQINEYTDDALTPEKIDEDFINRYIQKHDARVKFNIKIENIDNSEISDLLTALNEVEEKNIVDLTWSDYIFKVEKEKYQDEDSAFEQRIDLLDRVQNLFKKYKSLKNMPLEEQRIIAGIVLAGDNDFYPYRGWFGFLRSIGKLKGYYNEVGQHFNENVLSTISDALDLIPNKGKVTEEQYYNYINKIMPALGYNPKTTKSTAFFSRFLTLKRPDQFVVVNSGNRYILHRHFSINPDNPKKYWELIKWLQEAKWYEFGESDHPAWQYRMAFVDSLTYSYTNQDNL